MGMDNKYFPLTEEQELFRQTVQKIVEDKIAPLAPEIDENDEFCWKAIDVLREQELLGLGCPEEYGGGGADLLTCCLAVEEIAKASAPLAPRISASALIGEALYQGGTEEQKDKYLYKISQGEMIPAFALTEPEAGSDAFSLKTNAVEDEKGWVINGQKCFTTNADIADFTLVIARTSGEKGLMGLSGFMVDKETPGFTIGRIERKMAGHGIHTCEISFDDCRVPPAALLGEEGMAFANLEGLNKSRTLVGAVGVGLAQGAVDVACRYAKERQQFGRPIIKFQAIQIMLADMATITEAARQLVYKACILSDMAHADAMMLSSMSKYYATDVAMQVTTDAVQVLGGYGYMKDHPVERMMREAKLLQIFEGTNQIQRFLVARGLQSKY
jgi:alkylation response protein AidB-like acyl-CoA dehydrogenase